MVQKKMRATSVNGHEGHVFKLSAEVVLGVNRRSPSAVAIRCSVAHRDDGTLSSLLSCIFNRGTLTVAEFVRETRPPGIAEYRAMTISESKLAESAEVGICYFEFKLSGASPWPMKGSKKPDHKMCSAICVTASLNELIAPRTVAICNGLSCRMFFFSESLCVSVCGLTLLSIAQLANSTQVTISVTVEIQALDSTWMTRVISRDPWISAPRHRYRQAHGAHVVLGVSST